MKSEIVKAELTVINNKVNVMMVNNINYISLTDLARYANDSDPSGVIRNWMYLILWNSTELKLKKSVTIDLL